MDIRGEREEAVWREREGEVVEGGRGVEGEVQRVAAEVGGALRRTISFLLSCFEFLGDGIIKKKKKKK